MTVQDNALAAAYAHVATPADRLPYSPEMDRLVEEYSRRLGMRQTHRQCWEHLVDQRKHGHLPRVGRKKS